MEVAVEEVAAAAPGGARAGPWRARAPAKATPAARSKERRCVRARRRTRVSLSPPPASPAQVSRAPRGAPAPHMLVISIAHDVMASAAEVQRPLPEEQGAPRIPPPLTQPRARRGRGGFARGAIGCRGGAQLDSTPAGSAAEEEEEEEGLQLLAAAVIPQARRLCIGEKRRLVALRLARLHFCSLAKDTPVRKSPPAKRR